MGVPPEPQAEVPCMGIQPVLLQELPQLKSNALTSYAVAQVSELLRSALLHT